MLFHKMVQGPSIKELIALGYLVPVEPWAPSQPDLDKVKKRMGDYEKEALAEKMDVPQLVGDIVENWARICPDRQTVVFSVSVKHSIHIRDCFQEAGIKAEHLDGKTDKPERDELLRKFMAGEIQVITNCMVLTEGWDCPAASCCILARPTKSLTLYIQMAGRVLRPFPGKANAIMLDHAGVIMEHGFIDADRQWSLESGKKAKPGTAPGTKKESLPIICGDCAHVYSGQIQCPKCGWKPVTKGKPFAVIEGKLGKLDRKGKPVPQPLTDYRKECIYRELKYIQIERGYASGWLFFRYQDFCHEAASYAKDISPLEPSTEILRFIKRGNIIYAKRKDKRSGASKG